MAFTAPKSDIEQHSKGFTAPEADLLAEKGYLDRVSEARAQAKEITLTFKDGSWYKYNNVPNNITPDEVFNRVRKDFSDKEIVNIDGVISLSVISVNRKLDISETASNAGLSLGALLVFMLLYFCLIKCVGWIARGFLGIKMGSDI
jgi:hypothetical protein